MSYLKDIVETTHAFLKLMEHMSKSNHIMVSKKQKKVKPRKNTNKSTTAKGVTGSGDGFLSQRESNEQKWDQVSNELSALLQGSTENLPEIVSPFDAASDMPIGMYLIDDCYIRKNSYHTKCVFLLVKWCF